MPHFSDSLRVTVLVLASLSGRLLATEPGVRFWSIPDGLSEAQKTGKPMLIFFTADWCHPCQDMKRTVFSVMSHAKLIEAQFIPIEVLDRRHEQGANAHDIQTMLRWMNVHGFPTLVVCRPDGTDAIQRSGFSSSENTMKFLRNAISQLRKSSPVADR
jgi:thiol:disulfide interchange protein